MRHQSIAIIGGVASGPAAAAAARRVDSSARIVLFEQGSQISYSACEIPGYLSGRIESADELILSTPEEFQEARKVEVRTGARVERIDPRTGLLVWTAAAGGRRVEDTFDKFILATGARAVVPDLPGVDAANVFTLRRLDDAIGLREYLSQNTIHHAVVVGAGFIGLEVADVLTSRGIRVSILEPAAGPLHSRLGSELSAQLSDYLDDRGVAIRSEGLSGFESSGSGRVRCVQTTTGEKIGCQLVVLAMGTTPNTDLGVEAGIRIGKTGGFQTNERMRTNLPNVWACGDCAEVQRQIDGTPVISALSLTAFKTGRVAGRNAVRKGVSGFSSFPGIIGAQAIRVFDREIAFVGLTEEEARAAGLNAAAVSINHTTRSSLDPNTASITIRLVFELARGRVLGAQMIGGGGTALRANILIPLIRSRGTIADLYDLDLLYAPPFSPRLDPLLVAARKATHLRDDTIRKV